MQRAVAQLPANTRRASTNRNHTAQAWLDLMICAWQRPLRTAGLAVYRQRDRRHRRGGTRIGFVECGLRDMAAAAYQPSLALQRANASINLNYKVDY
jgi:hypothetical protein